ncbi:MAG: ISNCY family transposase [Nitrospira bacterium HGW-Nitrospira-1]|nr:MAG: ISNCY family transposase [Nitrospira bacterium HGW-Nitrospira-1]
MRITEKTIPGLLDALDSVKKELSEKEPEKYPFGEWERKRAVVKERLRNLPDYVGRAAGMIKIVKGPGQPKKMDLSKRTLLFIFARMMDKSNRDMEYMLNIFGPLFDVDVSYKYIERLYSDEEVEMTLHNLLILLLQNESVSGNFSGDGTGYTLSVARHYRTNPEKSGKRGYLYAFRLIDIDTGLYVALGYSSKSEMDAFNKAMKMLGALGIRIDSISLDRYYSSRKVLQIFDRETSVYVIPKKNLSNVGCYWAKILKRISENPEEYVRRYAKRNLSESGFSADKRRFGWKIRQKRDDRREMAIFSIGLLHNIFTVKVKVG